MYNLNLKHKQGTEKGLILSNRIKNSITTLYLSNNDFSSSTFKKNISNYFNSSKSFQSLVIYDNDKKMEYLYVKNPLILAEKPIFANDFIKKPEYKFNKLLFNLYSSSIIIPGGESKGLNIEIVYKIIGYYEISNLVKIVIICLLVYIISTAFFLLFVPYEKKNLKSENIGYKEEKKDTATIVPNTTEAQTAPEEKPQLSKVQAKEQPKAQPEVQQEVQAPDNSDSAPIKYTPLINEIKKSDIFEKEEPLDSIEANIKNDAINASISEESDTVADSTIQIDSKTGLANIDDFNPKLENELSKAAADDIDLSLLVLSFISEEKEKITVFYDNLPLLLRNFFMSQMSFSLCENKLAIIIPDKTIEESIKKTNEFIARLKNISTIENIYAGISSRNSRIISAERLIKEAEGAILKATSGSDNIVAFKSDPEKFREMIAKQNSL